MVSLLKIVAGAVTASQQYEGIEGNGQYNYIMGKWLPLFVLLLLPAAAGAQEGIHVEVKGLRNARGQVLVSVFASAEGFPGNPAKAMKTYRLKPAGRKAVVVIAGLAPGNYAIAILHDENNDAKMNTNVIGWPKEGFGFSNNAMGSFGPPGFSRARISYNGGQLQAAISTRYY